MQYNVILVLRYYQRGTRLKIHTNDHESMFLTDLNEGDTNRTGFVCMCVCAGAGAHSLLFFFITCCVASAMLNWTVCGTRKGSSSRHKLLEDGISTIGC